MADINIDDKILDKIIGQCFNLSKEELPTIEDILKEGSYLLYELEDVEETVLDDTGKEYTKKTSPFFSNKIINDVDKTNLTLLSILTEETPFYFLESSLETTIDDPYLSSTRDCGVNDVPSPLQESVFYEHWLRDTFGYLQNKILLDAYNKLRWPFINENQYLSAMLFDELAAKAGFTGQSSESSTVAKINFRKDKDEFDDISPSEYLDDIVNEKLISTYEMIDYNPLKTNYLTNIKDSMVASGVMKEKDSDFESSVYKLQDIKYELTRRKFAGSSSLYRLSLSSIGRRGSFIGALRLSDMVNETLDYGYFKDQRLVRLVSLPGITSNLAESVDLKALETYYYKPKEDGEVYIPLGIVEPLFYGSSDYNSGAFYSAYESDPKNRHYAKHVDYEQYLSTRLRSNQTIIEWDSPEGMLFNESIKVIPPTLDEWVLKSIYDGDSFAPDEKRLRHLDDIFIIPEELLEFGEESRQPLKLDIGSKQFNIMSICTNFLDISANKVLYHSNSLQQGDIAYKYVTYPIAYGNSISLMDVDWLDYIQTITERKSKVNDVIDYGVQVSKYHKLLENDEVKFRFFTISYDNKESLNINNISSKLQYDEITGEPVKYAYLWYCTAKYDASTKLSSRVYDTKLISKILISRTETKKEGESEVEITHPSTGVLPFTYSDMVDNKILGCKVEFTDGDKDVDDLDDLGYTKAYYFFSTYDYLKTADFMNNEYVVIKDNNFREIHTLDITKKNWEDEHEGEDLDYTYVYETLDVYLKRYSKYISFTPSTETKTVYYAVERDNKTLSWSEPIRVLKLNDYSLAKIQGSEIKPDWEGMCYYCNPYLNFTKESASPIRRKELLPRYQIENSESASDIAIDTDKLIGPGSSVALCNLTKMRHKDKICNDTGENTTFTDLGVNWYGFYLMRFDANDTKINKKNVYQYIQSYGLSEFLDKYNIIEPMGIYGDNRPKYSYKERISETEYKTHYYPDIVDMLTGTCERTTINYEYSAPNADTKANPSTESILFKIPNEEDIISKASEGKKDICVSNYYEVAPCNTRELNDDQKEFAYKYWYWDKDKKNNYPHEMTLCISVRPSDKISNNVVLLKREGEFSLKIKDKNIIEFVYGSSSGNRNITYSLGEGVSCVDKLLRITASVDSYTDEEGKENFRMSLCVNDKTQTLINIVRDIKVSYPNVNSIKVGYDVVPSFEINEDKVVLKTDTCFAGSLYDLRLYNVGYSPAYISVLNSGTMRELYSYSPSVYKLGHTIYEDNSIIKVSNKSHTMETPLHNVDAIRYLTRSVWDSILVDTYPICEEEKNPNSYMYYEFWKDPKEDTDVYKKTTVYKGGGEYEDVYDFNNTIEQYLEEDIEIYNNPNLAKTFEEDKLYIDYNRKKEEIMVTDSLTVLNTSLKPIIYNDYSFESVDNKLDLNVFNDKVLLTGLIQLPEKAQPCDGELSYKADIAFDFKIYPEAFFTSCLSKGNNISIKTINNSNEDDKYVVATISDVNNNSSNNNYITVPITIPYQEESKDNDMLYLDRFYLDSVTLNNSLKKLLTATSYYNEYRTGINYIDTEGTSKTGYLWDSIRVLKEGTYYFTCKYPVKLLPLFTEPNTNTNYSTFYASVRFKIVVTGKPIKYTKDNVKYNLDYSDGYKGLVVTPVDNKFFPHREINIDMYVMDVNGVAGRMVEDGEDYKEDYSFKWERIASNSVVNEDNLILLDDEFLKTGTTDNFIIDKKRIPLFLQKSYTTPFFICKTEKEDDEVKFNAKSADDDLIEPIIIKDRYNDINKESEKLWAKEEDDLDKQVIIAGRTYELMFDYEAKVSEISYTDKVFEINSVITDESSEKINFSRLTDITSTSNITENFEYMYTTEGKSFNFKDAVLYNNPCGYETKDYDDINLGWETVSKITAITIDNNMQVTNNGNIPTPFYFGNPYSRTRENNYLLNYKTGSIKNDIENSYWYPYCPTEYPDKYKSYFGIYNDKESKTRDFTGIVKLYNNRCNDVTAAIKNISNSTIGLFTQLYGIIPNIIRQKDDGTEQGVTTINSINADLYDLCGYITTNRTFNSLTNNVSIQRKGLYKNNLIKDQDFNNTTNWEVFNPTMRNILSAVSEKMTTTQLGYDKLAINQFSLVNESKWDKGAGKDVYSALITDTDNNYASLKYKKIFNLTTACELSINMCSLQQSGSQWVKITSPEDNSVRVYVDFYNVNNKEKKSYRLKKGEQSQGVEGWFNYCGDFDKDGEDIIPPYSSYYLGFHFEVGEEGTELTRIIDITKVIFRESTIKQHNLGFADVLKNSIQTEGENSIVELARNMVVFKKKTNDEVVPIQFLYSVNKGTASATSSLDFIKKYCGLTEDELSSRVSTFVNLTEPWIRRMSYKRVENPDYDPMVETSNKFKQVVHFYKPSVNIETADVLVESSDVLFYDPELNQLRIGEIIWEEPENPESRKITSVEGIELESFVLDTKNTNEQVFRLKQFNTNLLLDDIIYDDINKKLTIASPVNMNNEKLSMIVNCFNSKKYKDTSNRDLVCVTNMQLICKDEDDEELILYELEFLPVIYDERIHHLSTNILLHKETQIK